MSEFEDLNFENLLHAYKKAIDVNIIASVTDDKGTILYVNKKFCEVSKYPATELIGQNHRIINSGYHSREFFAYMWATIRSGNIWQGEIKNKTKKGNFYWVDTVILPTITDSKIHYLSLRKEITERKDLEEKKEEYLRSLEDLIFMTSHEIRRPVCSILGLLELQKIEISQEELIKILRQLETSVRDLDRFTRNMNSYLSKLKNRMK